MRAIIQSYTLQECERIANGRQTIKVCKNAPKDTPFKVYMYRRKEKSGNKTINEALDGVYGDGKVIGEYVCEKVDVAKVQGRLLGLYNSRFVDASDFSLIVKRCLDNSELSNYGRGKSISCLHISNVKIYDKPKELNEFNFTRPPHGWQYVEEAQ